MRSDQPKAAWFAQRLFLLYKTGSNHSSRAKLTTWQAVVQHGEHLTSITRSATLRIQREVGGEMVTKQYPFVVWDEHQHNLDSLPEEGDLVMVEFQARFAVVGPSPIGRFRGVERDGEDDGECVVLEVEDGIGGYDTPTLRTKCHRSKVEHIATISILVKRSSSASILFDRIGRLQAWYQILRTRIEQVTDTLDFVRIPSRL